MDCDTLLECGEFYAAGFFRDADAPIVIRMARAISCHLAHMELPPWCGRRLYPCDCEGQTAPGNLYAGSAVSFKYSIPMNWNKPALERKIEEAHSHHRQTLQDLQFALQEYPHYIDLGGWIHASVNFRRILAEGLDSYADRIQARQDAARGAGQSDKLVFYEALQITLDSIRSFHGRALAMLGEVPVSDPAEQSRRAALVDALRRVPFKPARTFYEAMVGENFIFYVDGCDGLGRFDQDLYPYYKADVAAGRATREEALSLIEELWTSIDCNWGWNVSIGGTARDGGDGVNELTQLCLEAARNLGRARPNLALRLREDSPREIWREAFRTLATGIGQPALYCEENYLRAIRETGLGVSEEDLPDFAFGGCTELIVHGKSCCGGADTYFNLPLVLDESIRAHLIGCETFDAFFDKFAADLLAAAQTAVDNTNSCYDLMALWQPQPIRSLLIDDCIDEGIEYLAGGARYNWSVTTIGGIANVADSLQALREVVFEKKELTASEMVAILKADFDGAEDVRLRLTQCARYGNGDARVDDLAAKIADITFRTFLSKTASRGGGRFVPGCIMLDWYVSWGKGVGALPDGRKAGEPIADSAGPYQGRDQAGPTAMLASVARLPQHLAPGTLVLNARFSRDMFDESGSSTKLYDLVRTYFKMGGMQIQINVVDQETLVQAMADPQAYSHLIVRIGGFSAYWGTLSEDARRTVLQRCEHA